MSQLKAFSNTKIDVFKTQNDLEILLTKRGIKASRWTHFAQVAKDVPGKMRFEFEWQPIHRLGEARPPLSFRIDVEYLTESGPNGGVRGTTREQAARALYWHIKNLFDAVDFGIVELEQAFMPYLLLPDGQTAYEKVGEQLQALQAGDVPRLLERGK